MCFKSLSATVILFLLVSVVPVAESHPSKICKKWFYYDSKNDQCRPCVPCKAPKTMTISRECALPARCSDRNEQEPLRCKQLVMGDRKMEGVECDWTNILGSTCTISQSGCSGEVTCQGNRTTDDLGYVIYTYWNGIGAACLPQALLTPLTKVVLAPKPLIDAADLMASPATPPLEITADPDEGKENSDHNKASIVISTTFVALALVTVVAAVAIYVIKPGCHPHKSASVRSEGYSHANGFPGIYGPGPDDSQLSFAGGYDTVAEDPDGNAAADDAAVAERQPLTSHPYGSRDEATGDVNITPQLLVTDSAAIASEDAMDIQLANHGAIQAQIEQTDNGFNTISETADTNTSSSNWRLQEVDNANTTANSLSSPLQQAMASNDRRPQCAGSNVTGRFPIEEQRQSTDRIVYGNTENPVTLRVTIPTDSHQFLSVDNNAHATAVKEVVGAHRMGPMEHDEQIDAHLSLISHEEEEHSSNPRPLQVTDRSMDHKQ